jgi:uncharacterized membrane protein YccC
MRLAAKKTWSQQDLATKLHMGEADEGRLLSWERKRLLIHAAKTALTAALCWWLALRFGLHEGYWAAISAIIVLQSNFGSTVTASRDRILGTVIGALLGFAFSLVGTLPWNYIAAVFSAIAICGLLGLRASSRLAGVTITIVMLVQAGSAQDGCFDARGRGDLRNRRGSCSQYAGVSRSSPSASSRRIGAGVPSAWFILRSNSSRFPRCSS